MPATKREFFKALDFYIPHFMDVKLLSAENLSLKQLEDKFRLRRQGQAH
jgi:hypothetical protein